MIKYLKENFKKIVRDAGLIVLGTMLASGVVYGATILFPSGGGTGVGTLPASQLIYGNGISPVGSVATGTVTCVGTVSCGTGSYVVGNSLTITGSGGGASGSGTVSTSTPLVSGQVDFSTGVSTIGNDSTFLFDTTFKRLTAQNASTTAFSSFYASSTIGNIGTLTVGLSQGFAGIGTNGLLYSFATSSIKTSQLTNDAGFVTSSGVTSVTGTWPIISSGGNTPNITYGGFGTTTDTGIGNDLILYTSHTGIVKGVASSSLSLPNSALQTSTISGVALGSNLFSHTHDTSFTGTSYNGSAAVSDWGLALNHTNTWSVLQNFNYSSSSLYSSFVVASSTETHVGTGQGIAFVGTNGLLAVTATSSFSLSQFTNNLANLTALDTSLTLSGNYNGSVARTITLNTGNTNTWTVLQNFNYSSSTLYSSFFNASSTFGSVGTLTVGTLSGLLKGTAGLVSTASNGTDYSLISALTCGAGQHFSQVTASGTFTCTADSGGGGSGGGTFATTTVPGWTGVLFNYPLNATDVVGIGSTSGTSTSKYYFDPNTQSAQIGTSATASTTIYGNPTFPSISQGIAFLGTNGKLGTVATSSFSLSQFTNDLASLSATNASLTFSGSYNGSAARTVGLNLANSNTWSVLQNFNYSSSTLYSSFFTASTTFLTVNGESFNDLTGTGLSIVGNALTNAGVISLGNGTGTTCSGTNPGTCNVNASQNITTLSNLTTNGLVTTSGSNGTLGVTQNSTNGLILAMSGGIPTWVASTTFGSGFATTSLPYVTHSTSTLAFDGVTFGMTIVPSAGALNFTPTATGNFNSLSHDTSFTGTTYNLSGAVSDWGLALNHTNTWSVLQNFNYSSSTLYSSFAISSSTETHVGTGQGFAYVGTNGLLGAISSSTAKLSWFTNDLSNLTATNASLTFSGSYNGSSAQTVGLNLGNTNTWSVLQNFNYSSSTLYSSFLNASSTNLFAGFLTLSTTTAGCLNSNSSGVVYIATCSAGGGITSLTVGAGFQNQGTVITSTGTIVGAFASSSNPSLSNIPYVSGVGDATNPIKFAFLATSSLSGGGPITVSNSPFIIGASTATLGCNVASASVTGCINASDFSKFNSATTTFTSPLVYTLGTNAVTCPTCMVSYDAWTHPQVGFSATTSSMVFGTSTAANNLATLTLGSTTASQLALFAGPAVAGWTFRNAGGNMYISTTNTAGSATTSPPGVTWLSNGNEGLGTSTPPSPFTLNLTSAQLISTNPAVLIGTSTLASPSANGTYFAVNSSTGFTGDYLNFQNSGTASFTVTQSASGFGTLSAGTTTSITSVGAKIVSASSTQAQLALVDGLGSQAFNFRSIGSQFFIATSSATSPATSTNPVFANKPGTGGKAGNTGIGTSSPQFGFGVEGTVAFNGIITSSAGNTLCILATQVVTTGNQTACSTSSMFTKHDIQDISLEDAMKVLNLRSVTYVENESGKAKAGFLAEDASSAYKYFAQYADQDTTYPKATKTIKKGEPITVDINAIVSALRVVVKNQGEKINKLEDPKGVQKGFDYKWLAIILLTAYAGYNEYDKRK